MPKILEILTDPNPLLKKIAKSINSDFQDIKPLIDDMVLTMRKKDGMGLAAPQIGKSARLAVVEYTTDDKNNKPNPLPLTVLINPKIIYYSTDFAEQEEGCLSIPGKQLKIIRPNKIKVIYFDTSGRRRRLDAVGTPSRIIQHEIDHLDGKLITDRYREQQKVIHG